MIFTEKNIDDRKINQLVGGPIKLDWKKPKTIGGPGLILKKFVNKTDREETLKVDSKCNLEKRSHGLILHTNFSNSKTLIPISLNDIEELKIVRGKEEIRTFFPYPMWILLKLGVSIIYARYFGLRHYRIEQMELSLRTTDYDIGFIANGFLFERHLNFLQGLGIENKLVVEKKPAPNIGYNSLW